MNEQKQEPNKDWDKIRDNRKSWVRVIVTYIAAAFLFVGGAIFIIVLVCMGKIQDATNLFQTLLPVAAAIISFWFAGRGVKQT